MTVEKDHLFIVMVKIGVNGFGRLGRLFLRIALDQCGKGAVGSDLPIVTIVNDTKILPETMGYLLKNDSIHGPYKKEIIEMDNCIMVEGNRIEAVQEKDISKIPWNKSCNIDYVVDTTGKIITCAAASQHLQDKIKGVLVTGCADIPVFCMGVNHTCYKPTMKTISVGTASLQCVSAMLRVLQENFKIEKAMATIITPINNTDKLLDDSSESSSDPRDSRSGIQNFRAIKSSASGRFLSRIIPELEGKYDSNAIKIPIPAVGAVDLTAILCKDVSYEIVKVKLKEASECYMKGIIRMENGFIVSSDIKGDSHSCIIDGKSGLGLPKNCVKLFAWYDAEYAFAHRLYDMIKYIASRETC